MNVAVDPDTPLWLLCPYDVTSLPDDVIDEAHRSHPVIVEPQSQRGSASYLGAHHVGALFDAELPPPGADVPVTRREYGRGDLGTLRADVVALAMSIGVRTDRAEDLALAVHEVAANSLEHGLGQRSLDVWRSEGALLCEIRDAGRIDDPLVGRREIDWEDERGRGLWMANQLCDLVQIRFGPPGHDDPHPLLAGPRDGRLGRRTHRRLLLVVLMRFTHAEDLVHLIRGERAGLCCRDRDHLAEQLDLGCQAFVSEPPPPPRSDMGMRQA